KWAASLVAARGTDSPAANRTDRVRQMFLVALGRPPDAEELAAACSYLDELSQDHRVATGDLLTSVAVWQDFAQSLFCLKEFQYVR
ncbi:MAG: hypothetical protein ACKOUR_10080, partial [Planctomycetota bacterium]